MMNPAYEPKGTSFALRAATQPANSHEQQTQKQASKSKIRTPRFLGFLYINNSLSCTPPKRQTVLFSLLPTVTATTALLRPLATTFAILVLNAFNHTRSLCLLSALRSNLTGLKTNAHRCHPTICPEYTLGTVDCQTNRNTRWQRLRTRTFYPTVRQRHRSMRSK